MTRRLAAENIADLSRSNNAFPSLTEGQIDREEKFWFEAAHVNAMIAVIEAEAVTAAPDLRDWLISLAAFARRAVDRHVGVVFVIS
jgi:hypothetical protein